MNKILILEDDSVLLETLEDELRAANYKIDTAKHGEEVLDLTSNNKYDLYIFDINVPYINGIDLLKDLRESGDQTAAIFLTSRNEEVNRLNGFSVGCDDYIVKPFSLSELKLRIQAILRRTTYDLIVACDDIKIDLHNNMLEIENTPIIVDKKTLEVLHLFISNPNNVFSVNDIIEHLYNNKTPSYTVIRVHISKINRLFETKRIHNIRGLGYRYENK